MQRVPMIRRADQHNIEVLFLEHFAIIVISAGRLLGFLALAGDLDRLGQHVFVGITNGNDLDGCYLDQSPQIALAIPAGANQTDAFGFFSGEGCGYIAGSGKGNEGSGTSLEELTTIHTFAWVE